jgi:hypothetical protein
MTSTGHTIHIKEAILLKCYNLSMFFIFMGWDFIIALYVVVQSPLSSCKYTGFLKCIKATFFGPAF